MSVKRGMSGVIVLLTLAGPACSPSDETTDALATDSVVATSSEEIKRDNEPQATVRNEDPFGEFGMEASTDAAATISETPVWLINGSNRSLIVTARGGAGSVVIDTIDAADSVLVTIDTRAHTVELVARTPDGVPMGTLALPMDSEPKRAAFPH